MKLKISSDLRQKIETRIGRSADELRIIPVYAYAEEQQAEATELELAKFTAAAGVEEAAGPPMLSNGKPTVMRMVAWMAHEGVNRNRQGFVKDELPAAAEKIDTANALVMDFNHSAVRFWSDDPKAIGYWHKAEYRRDPRAANGEGKFGIMLTGTMWSWAFPDHANRLLAEQARNPKGVIEYSMACLPETVEIGRDDEGHFEILHNPTFFTLSALDVPPADPDALGVGIEGSDAADIDTKLTEKLTGEVATAAAVAPLTEEQMEELMKQIAELKTQIEGMADVSTKLEKAESDLAAANTQVEELTAKLTEAKTPLEGVSTAGADAAKLEEMEMSRDGLKVELEAAQAKVTELTESLTAATEKLSGFEAAAADAAKAELLAARLAELPKSYIAAFEKRSADKQTEMKTRWASMSDEAWSELKDTLGVGEFQISYLAISEAEGGALPHGDAESNSIGGLLSKIKK